MMTDDGLMPYYEELAGCVVEQALRDYVAAELLPDYRPTLELVQQAIKLLEPPMRERSNFTLTQRKEMFKAWVAFNDTLPPVAKLTWRTKHYSEDCLAAKDLASFFKPLRRIYNKANLLRTDIRKLIDFHEEEPGRVIRFIESPLFELYTGHKIPPETVINFIQEEVSRRKENGETELEDDFLFGIRTIKRSVKRGPVAPVRFVRS